MLLFWDSIQYPHSIYCFSSLWSPKICNSTSPFLDLYFLMSIDQLFCQMSLDLDLYSVFPRLVWDYFSQEYHRNDVVSFSVHCIMGFMMSVCLVIGSVDIDYLVKMVSAGFLHLTVTTFSLVINKYRGEMLWDYGNPFFSSNFHTLILACNGGSWFCIDCYYAVCFMVIFYFSLYFDIYLLEFCSKEQLSLPSI